MLIKKLSALNKPLLVLTFALLAYGFYAIYSATWMRDTHFTRSQFYWLLLCLPIFFTISFIDYRWVRLGAIPLYLLSLLGLLSVLLFGVKVYGARSWLNLGFCHFQPSELAIIAGIMVLALYLSSYEHLSPLIRIGVCGAIVGIPWLLVLVQPNLGGAIVWLPLFFAMLYIGNVPGRYLLTLLLLGVSLIPVMVNFGMKPYQRDRIAVFLDPSLDPQGAGWNINQSLNAIGSGGFLGKGFKASNTLNELGYLPSTIVHNDFIFSVLGEQHGFFGGFLLITTFMFFILSGLFIAFKANDTFGRLLAIGIVTLLFTHVFMNIGMTIGVTPITGLPLPLVSYGGSFLLIAMLSLGLLQSIWIHRKLVY
ncbi:MAG: rod shape-determining protein RodA [Verrucomicrobia bacterium RIFCSPHIGHO2_12_FULL_41_10]|nr:MAG: rod shape-determining protein RodA [Verrucomicrobia bacterium RIFCSPHIGHO2_12_FULL_41_10]